MSQRRRFLIDPVVQLALIRRMLMHWSIAVLALMGIGILVQFIYQSEGRSLAQAIAWSFKMQVPLLCVMFMLMPIYVWDVIKLSHRFTGPMLRLRGVLNEIADGGKAPNVRFRPGDFWQETADDFNRFYGKHKEVSEELETLRIRCAELEQQLETSKATV